MKLTIGLSLTQNDTLSVKGEELDEQIITHCEGLEADGWEVKGVSILREKNALPADYIVDMLTHALASLISPDMDVPERPGQARTPRQAAMFFIEAALARVQNK